MLSLCSRPDGLAWLRELVRVCVQVLRGDAGGPETARRRHRSRSHAQFSPSGRAGTRAALTTNDVAGTGIYTTPHQCFGEDN